MCFIYENEGGIAQKNYSLSLYESEEFKMQEFFRTLFRVSTSNFPIIQKGRLQFRKSKIFVIPYYSSIIAGITIVI